MRAPILPALALALVACGGDAAAPKTDSSGTGGTVTLDLQRVATGLGGAVHVVAPPGDARLFVVEQSGTVRIVRDGAVVATPFLDLSSRISTGGERGLLSLAFDPAFATNGRVYAYFTNTNGDIEVDRFVASGDVASAASATPVITIPHPGQSNHNGGLVAFGPDGMLYLATGDGGAGGDPPNNAQNLGVLLGKLLRLDVRSLPYAIPADNPFVGQSGKRAEIWAYGLRNPFRFAFDPSPASGAPDLYIGDVGQDAWEEIDAVSSTSAGLDYGWRVLEGTSCYPSGTSSCDRTGRTLPVHTYSHGDGCAITGGVVYRGAAIAELRGQYFFSDYCSGWLKSLARTGGLWTVTTWSVPAVGNVRSFGTDGAGELYLATSTGVWKLVRK